MNVARLEHSPASEFQTGIRALTILTLPKPGSSVGHPCILLLCAAFTAKEELQLCATTELPEQKERNSFALPDESSKRFPNSHMLMWTQAAEVHQ